VNAKQRACEIYKEHILLAAADGKSFRKNVMDQLMAETGCSLASASTHYNNAKKLAPVEGLGRQGVSKGARKVSPTKARAPESIPDNECFSVVEVNKDKVGRTQSFTIQGDASEAFDSKIEVWPRSTWIMIQGLGPNGGDTFELEEGEKEIKRYTPLDK